MPFRPPSQCFLAFGLLGLLSAAGCSRSEPPPSAPPPSAPPPAPEPVANAPAEPVVEEPVVPVSSTTRLLTDVGFRAPESVLYDPEQDVYFVSNVNGDPFEKDGNGFIAKVNPDGEQVEIFIQGGQGKVELHAPKGMAVVHDTLVVADIDVLRLFHRRTGAPMGRLAVEGASFLNDVAIGPDDKTVYVTDTGLKPGFEPSGTDAVYRVVDGKISKLASGRELGQPNGLLPEANGTWVVTFGSGELYWLGNKGRRDRIQTLPQGGLDGIVRTRDGRLLVSSWKAATVYGGTPSGDFVPVLSGVTSPADIGYDKKRNRLLVPLFEKDALVLHSLDEDGGSRRDD